MCANLTPAQIELAMLANRAALAGLPSVANAFAESLRRQIAQSHPPFPCDGLGRAQGRGFYGRFKLTEADECALENVESPVTDQPKTEK